MTLPNLSWMVNVGELRYIQARCEAPLQAAGTPRRARPGCGGVRCIVARLLRRKGVRVPECDQPKAIRAKQRIAREHWPSDHVHYIALDLHDDGWAGLARALDENGGWPVLVMMEGVSPYVSTSSFEAFVRFLAGRLDPRSVLAYDFKIAGTTEDVPRAVAHPFRLPAERRQVAAYHAALVPAAPLLFDRDCLLRLSPFERVSP